MICYVSLLHDGLDASMSRPTSLPRIPPAVLVLNALSSSSLYVNPLAIFRNKAAGSREIRGQATGKIWRDIVRRSIREGRAELALRADHGPGAVLLHVGPGVAAPALVSTAPVLGEAPPQRPTPVVPSLAPPASMSGGIISTIQLRKNAAIGEKTPRCNYTVF